MYIQTKGETMNREDIDIRNCMHAVEQKKPEEQIVGFDEYLCFMSNNESGWTETDYELNDFDHVFFIGTELNYYFYLAKKDNSNNIWIFRQKRV